MKKSVILTLSILLSIILIGCDSEESKRTNKLLERQIKITEEIKQLIENEVKQNEESRKKSEENKKQWDAPTKLRKDW